MACIEEHFVVNSHNSFVSKRKENIKVEAFPGNFGEPENTGMNPIERKKGTHS